MDTPLLAGTDLPHHTQRPAPARRVVLLRRSPLQIPFHGLHRVSDVCWELSGFHLGLCVGVHGVCRGHVCGEVSVCAYMCACGVSVCVPMWGCVYLFPCLYPRGVGMV